MQRILKYTILVPIGLCLALTVSPIRATVTPSIAIAAERQLPNPLEGGRNFYSAGRFAEAAETWQVAVQEYAARGDRANQALSLSYLSLAYQELNQWDAAKDAIAQSIELLESGSEPILWAQALNTQASLLLHTGQAQAALDTWKRAQDSYKDAGDEMGALGAQINQAQALQNLGFYRRSQQLLEDLNNALIAAPDSQLKVSSLRSLGETLLAIGYLPESREVQEYTLEVAQRLETTPDLSAIFLSLGNTALGLDDLGAALTYFEQAEEVATNPLDRVEAQLARLRFYIKMEQWQLAANLAPQIYQALAQLPPSRMSIYSSVNLAASLQKMGDRSSSISPQELNQLLAKNVQGAKTLQDGQAQAYALQQWSKLYERNKQPAEAMQLARESLAIARELQSEDIASQSAWQLGKLLKQQGQKKEAIAAYSEAVNSLQALRQDLVAIDRNVQFSFRESIEPVYRELVELLLDGNPSQESLGKARDLVEGLQLAELDNFFRQACIDAQPRQIDQIDAEAAVVYPIILSDRIAVILSTPGQPVRYYATPVSQVESEKTLKALLASLNPVSDNTERLRLSQQVYDWLIRPGEAEGAFTHTNTLVFVLDGRLRNIPMAALHDGQQYLIEKYSVALSPGLQLMEPRSLARTSLNAIVGGISESRYGLSALPAVQSEIQEIARLIPAFTLLNQEFTQDALTEQLKTSSSRIVHLATHGQFSSRQEDTFLLTWEGRINIQELSELLQSRDKRQDSAIELLVLSACDTATGDERAVLGLAGIAVRSGARSTLATLWPVKDKAAATLMAQFYKEIQQPGITKAEALRRAQLALLEDETYEDPFFWSPFVLVGNWL
jgi:CHAT domain-containing protein